METTEAQRRLTVRHAMHVARVAANVRVHVVDRIHLHALWAAGIPDGVRRDRHVPPALLVAVGRRDAFGELVLSLSCDLPPDGHVRAILPELIVIASIELSAAAVTAPVPWPVQMAALYRDGDYAIVEQSPRPSNMPAARLTRGA